jgi:hypothetical protein
MEGSAAPAAAMSDDHDRSGEASWMDFAKMRSLGVRSVQFYCSCHYSPINAK